MLIRITRDSVCAGDDVDAPHEEMRQVSSEVARDEILAAVCRGYVDVHYPEQIWICVWNGRKVALFSQKERILHLDRMEISETNDVHFKYVWDRDGFQRSQRMEEDRGNPGH